MVATVTISSDFSPADIESWQCYRSGSVNILCRMLISWGIIWFTDRQSSIWLVLIWPDGISYGQRWTFWIF